MRNRNINLIRLLEEIGCYTCKSYTNELHERVIEVFLGEDAYLVTLFRNDQGNCYVDSYNTIYDYGKIRAKVIAITTKERSMSNFYGAALYTKEIEAFREAICKKYVV